MSILISLGTALGVIIPEGFETLSNSRVDHSMKHVAVDLASENPAMVDIMIKRHSTESQERKHTFQYVGLSLVLGFCSMFLVDRLGHSHSHHSASLPTGSDENLTVVDNKWSTTIGLLVHSAADGVALGAASSMEGNFCFYFQ